MNAQGATTDRKKGRLNRAYAITAGSWAVACMLLSASPSQGQPPSQAELAKIAIESKDSDARDDAVRRLTDQTLLAKIAVEGCDTSIRCNAVTGLIDRAVLAKIAVEDKAVEVRKAANHALSVIDAINDKDGNVRLAAVKNLRSQGLLARVAVEDKDAKVRRAATQNLANKALLANIAAEDKDVEVRCSAIGQLTDQALLTKLAVQGSDPDVRLAALENLGDKALDAKMDAELTAGVDNVGQDVMERFLPQALLARIAVEDRIARVRNGAVAYVTDRALLTKIAISDSDNDVCYTAVESLNNQADCAGLAVQAMLVRVATEARDGRTRYAAIYHLTDSVVLARIAVADKDDRVRQAAIGNLADQALLAKLAIEDRGFGVREAAVKRLTNQVLLAKIAAEAKDIPIRIHAMERLTDHALLAKILKSPPLGNNIATSGKLDSYFLLRRWAEHDSQAGIRLAAVRRITDERFLANLLEKETSAAVRSFIIATLQNTDSMAHVALTAYHEADRKRAVKQLDVYFGQRSFEVAKEQKALADKVKALAAESDNGKLRTLAIEGTLDVLCTAAARRIADQATLEQVAVHGSDREVLRIVLAKLNDKAMLDRIATAADDRAMRLAAAKKANSRSWQAIFDAAIAKDATPEMLGDAVAAVALFPEVQKEATASVRQACLRLIRRGDESRVPEMAELLANYGDTTLVQACLDSCQPDLDAAAQEWAHRHACVVDPGNAFDRPMLLFRSSK
jgi:hypothetical protein